MEKVVNSGVPIESRVADFSDEQLLYVTVAMTKQSLRWLEGCETDR